MIWRTNNLTEIDCYISEGCGSEDGLKKNIKKALEKELLDAEVTFHRINEKEANELGLRGSPTVLINDVDNFARGDPGYCMKSIQRQGRTASASTLC